MITHLTGISHAILARFALGTAAGLCLSAAPVMSANAQEEAASSEQEATGEETTNPDEMANDLNAAQKLQQTVTFTRSINGEVLDSETKTVTYDRSDPVLATEAGTSPLVDLRQSFDREVLTRNEAFEEAKLDFALADTDRNKKMSADEFVTLIDQLKANEARLAQAESDELERQARYINFIAAIDPVEATAENEALARAKFNFMSGVAGDLSQRDYVREYLVDFDAMDEDGNGLLKGDELLKFRAAHQGRSLDF